MDLNTWVKTNKIDIRIMATSIGITYNYLYQISKGHLQPSYDTAKAIEAYTDGEVKTEEIRTKQKKYCPACGKRMRLCAE